MHIKICNLSERLRPLFLGLFITHCFLLLVFVRSINAVQTPAGLDYIRLIFGMQY
jgi:hypothetical protein